MNFISKILSISIFLLSALSIHTADHMTLQELVSRRADLKLTLSQVTRALKERLDTSKAEEEEVILHQELFTDKEKKSRERVSAEQKNHAEMIRRQQQAELQALIARRKKNYEQATKELLKLPQQETSSRQTVIDTANQELKKLQRLHRQSLAEAQNKWSSSAVATSPKDPSSYSPFVDYNPFSNGPIK